MKSKLFMVVAALLALVSCKEDSAPLGDITTSSDNITFAADQLTSQQLTVTCDGFWYFSVSESWVSVTRADNELTISVSKNNAKTARTAVLTILSVAEGGPSKEVTITQNGMPEGEEPVLELSSTEVVFAPIDPETVVIEVITAGGVEWACMGTGTELRFFDLQASEDNTKVSFIPYGSNDSGMKRKAEVIFYNKNNKVQVPVVRVAVTQDLPEA